MGKDYHPFPALIDGLVEWYLSVRRPFPWRLAAEAGHPDPYSIWIVEVMSQQSTMASVLPFYDRWMKKFPDLASLATASEESVLESWAGLGYYSRARNVHKAAKELLARRERTGEAWPRTTQEWLDLPGVGPYTAAAVTAISFEAPVLPLDGNVLRVLSRFHGIPDALNSGADRKRVEEWAGVWAGQCRAGLHGHLAQAFMELGARVCRPGPLATCDLCPLNKTCVARAQKNVEKIPRAKKRREQQKVPVLALLYRKPGSGPSSTQVLLRKIPEGKRLQGQWELPQWLPSDEEWGPTLERISKKFEVFGPVRHTITHHLYEVWGVEAGAWSGELPTDHVFGLGAGTATTLTRKLLRLKEAKGG